VEIRTEFDRVGLVLDIHRHVENLGDALARGHGPLHHRILHGEGADRIEEALDIEQEGDHDSDVQAVVQHHRTADDNHHRHGDAGQRVHDRHHDLGEAGGAQMRLEIGEGLFLVEVEIDFLPVEALYRPHAVYALRQRAV